MTGPTKSTVRVAVIGAGSMANSVHYPSLASFDDVEIAAICDLDPARLHSTADRYGIERRYSDYQQMVAEVAPDGVSVVGRPHLMFGVGGGCHRRGQNLTTDTP